MLPDHVAIESETDSSAARGLLAVLVLLVVGAVTWASLAEIDSIIVAQGKLATTAPNIVIQPIDTAVIRSIDVRVGDVVKKGQHLGHLDPTFTQADLAQKRLELKSLEIQIRRLNAELTDAPFLAQNGDNSIEEKLNERIRSTRSAEYEAQLRAFSTR